jgi:TPR repeat protein
MFFKPVLLALGLAFSVMAHAGLAEGQAAYDKHDYATALKEWQPLAEQGEAAAQLKLGVMYAKGLGVAQSDATASLWFRKSAEQGNPLAQNLLDTLNSGHSVHINSRTGRVIPVR